MQVKDKAEVVFDRSVTEALGYIELAKEQQSHGCDVSKLIAAALESLKRFSDDDDLIDAIYEADMANDPGE
jgi:hypothetical protein